MASSGGWLLPELVDELPDLGLGVAAVATQGLHERQLALLAQRDTVLGETDSRPARRPSPWSGCEPTSRHRPPDLRERPRRDVIDGFRLPPDAPGSHEPARTGRPLRRRCQSVSAPTTAPSRGRRSTLPVLIVPVMTASSSGDQNAKAPHTPWWPITCAAGNR
jgi:hypothetical protein